MDIYLYNNLSPDIKIHKNIIPVAILTGALRNDSHIVNPVIRVEYANLPAFNYAFIPEFNRYYFAHDIKVVRNNIFDISLQSDVLMSFDLSAITGVVIESSGGNNYLPARNWIRSVKTKTDIVPFSNGLLNSGEYILITAGG